MRWVGGAGVGWWAESAHSVHLEKKRRARRGATRGGGEMEDERGRGREENISILHVNNNEYFFLIYYSVN